MFLPELRRVALLEIALETLEPLLDNAEVRENDLVLHGADVAGRIDRTGGMRNRRVAEHANDVEQGIGVAKRRDVEQRLSSGP